MRRFALVLLIVAAASAAAWALIGRTRAAAAPRHLILITIDTLRADRLHAATMPRLTQFAEEGRRFTHARTTAPLTLPAHASVMTGMWPPAHGVRENGARLEGDPPLVARWLRQAGFRTGGFVSAFVLDRQFGLAEGFETYDDAIARDPAAPLRLEAERPASATVDAALTWLRSIDLTRERVFLWVHVFEPHAPYAPAYDDDVRSADAAASRLIESVMQMPGAESTGWMMAGDHGEALGSHGEVTHGMLLYDATLRVPLVIKGPGVTPGVESAPVSLIDIAPTAFAWLGVDLPKPMAGADLRGRLAPDRDVYSETMYPRTAGWHGLSALSGARWKAIRSSEIELYDVAADADEARNVAAEHARTADAMREAAARIDSVPTPAPQVSAEVQERLRALGYVGGGSARASSSTARNPAREIASWVRFEQALTRMAGGRAREVLPELRDLSAKHPEARVFKTTYARALQESGDAAAAVRVYKEVASTSEMDPVADSMLLHDLASAAREAGDRREAEQAERAAIGLDPRNAAAVNGLGLMHADAGDHASAAVFFARAAARDPGNASYWTNLGNARRALGDLTGAGEAYRRALERDPAYADALNGQGVLLVQSGRARDAIALFERAIARDASHIEARLNLGIAYQESGRVNDAARMYRDVVARSRPDSREHAAARALLDARR